MPKTNVIMKKIYFLVVGGMLLSLSAFSQSKLSAYSRAVLSEKIENIDRRVPLRNLDNRQYIDVFIEVADASQLDALQAAGAIIGVVTDKYITAQIPLDAVEAVEAVDNVRLIDVARRVRLKNDKARSATNHNLTLSGNNGELSTNYDGSGVIVGNVDTGVDFNHPAFKTSDGTTRFIAAYLPSNNNGEKLSGRCFDYSSGTFNESTLPGSFFLTNSAIKSLTTDYSSESHGSHTLGTLGGYYSGNNYSGFAQKADLYSCATADLTTVNIVNGIAYAFDEGTRRNQPVVMSVSLGDNLGSHDSSLIDAYMIDQLSGPGKIVVIAAGNEGGDKLHLQSNFADGEPVKTFVTDYYETTSIDSYLDVWDYSNDGLQVTFSVVNKSGNTVYATSSTCSKSKDYVKASLGNYFSGTLVLNYDYNEETGWSNVSVIIDGSLKSSSYYLCMTIDAPQGSDVHAWTDTYSWLKNLGVKGFTAGDSNYSINSMACGYRSISVGSFVTRYSSGSEVGEVSSFSSYGPTIDGRQAPQVLAPGESLISALNSYDKSSSSSAASATVNGRTYKWGAMAGTSMATPAAAGIIAAWMQADPLMSPEDVKEVLAATCVIDNAIASTDPNKVGYGKIDSYNGLLEVLRKSSVRCELEARRPLMIYPNPSNGRFSVFAPSEPSVSITVCNLNGAVVASKHVENTMDTIECDFSNCLASGTYIVTVTGNQTRYTSKLVVK